jgi:CRP-like cAMP-binding protein
MNERENQAQDYDGGNVFLDGLPEAEREALRGRLSVVELDAPESIFARDGAINEVYFPIDCLFSVTAELRRESTAEVYEVGVLGREGIVGAEVALGAASSRRFVLTQVGGRAARLPAAELLRRTNASAAFLGAIHEYMLRRMYHAEQLVGCGFAHSLTQRCALWILTVRDKVGRSEFVLRREFLGMMLAIEQSAVDAATAELQAVGAIRYDPAESVTILRPRNLLQAACECYEALREHGVTLPPD